MGCHITRGDIMITILYLATQLLYTLTLPMDTHGPNELQQKPTYRVPCQVSNKEECVMGCVVRSLCNPAG